MRGAALPLARHRMRREEGRYRVVFCVVGFLNLILAPQPMVDVFLQGFRGIEEGSALGGDNHLAAEGE